MAILRLLSEEIFDYSAEQMTQVKTKNLKNQMCGEFSEVFQLCSEVLEKAQKPSLIKATLETMLKFLNWIPLGYIFETNVIDHLIGRVSIVELINGVGADWIACSFSRCPNFEMSLSSVCLRLLGCKLPQSTTPNSSYSSTWS